MRIIEEKVYKFNELSKEVQERLIEKEKENVKNDYIEFCLYDDMVEESKELLKKYFGDDVTFTRVLYDLSYCQGAGAMIEFSINFEDLNKKYHIVSEEEERFITDTGAISTINVMNNDCGYYHEYLFTIDYYCDVVCYSYDDVKDEYKITESDFDTLESRINEVLYGNGSNVNDVCKFRQDVVNMNKELTKSGYKWLEEDCDIGYIKENLNDNEYYENGEVY